MNPLNRRQFMKAGAVASIGVPSLASAASEPAVAPAPSPALPGPVTRTLATYLVEARYDARC
jgi:hypothetical protein